MRRKVVGFAVLLLVAALTGGVGWVITTRPEAWAELQAKAAAWLGLDADERPDSLTASGFIEAQEVSVGTELGGRIAVLGAAEGDRVKEGQILVRLDDALLGAHIEQARAELAVAEATLAQVRAGVRPETLAYAETMLEQARQAAEAARVAWEDAEAMRDNPQQLELAFAAARSQLGVLDLQLQQAQAMANSGQAGRELADTAVAVLEGFEPFKTWVLIGSYTLGNLPAELPLPDDFPQGERRWGDYKIVVHGRTVDVYAVVRARLPGDALSKARYEQASATVQSWTAWTALAEAEAARQGAERYLAELEEQVQSPLALSAQANAAEAQYQIARASVAVAEAHLAGMQLGATPEQVAMAEAQVEIARAALETLEVQRQKFILTAPISGLLLEQSVHEGEVAIPGAPLLTLADLNDLILTVYVPESDLGQIRVGLPVSVTVDAYPGRVFEGTIVFIASEAEFTPKNVQTREERVNMVFAVKVKLPNLDQALKPGMPADAAIPLANRPDPQQGGLVVRE